MQKLLVTGRTLGSSRIMFARAPFHNQGGADYAKEIEIVAPGLLSCTDERMFWLSWMDGYIVIGRGLEHGKNALMSMYDYDPFIVKAILMETRGVAGTIRVAYGGQFEVGFKTRKYFSHLWYLPKLLFRRSDLQLVTNSKTTPVRFQTADQIQHHTGHLQSLTNNFKTTVITPVRSSTTDQIQNIPVRYSWRADCVSVYKTELLRKVHTASVMSVVLIVQLVVEVIGRSHFPKPRYPVRV